MHKDTKEFRVQQVLVEVLVHKVHKDIKDIKEGRRSTHRSENRMVLARVVPRLKRLKMTPSSNASLMSAVMLCKAIRIHTIQHWSKNGSDGALYPIVIIVSTEKNRASTNVIDLSLFSLRYRSQP